MIVSRRALFKTLLQGAGAGLILSHRLPIVEGGQGDERAQASGPLTVRVARPFDAETPVREFASWLTPNERFFVRSHFGPPAAESVQVDTWRLTVKGLVKDGLSLSLKELQQFEAVTLTAVLQCSGNGRAHHRPKVPGVQWERGAVGNAQWTGARLRDVLQRAGVKPQGLHVQLQGADRPTLATVPLFTRSIPLAKAKRINGRSKMNFVSLLIHGLSALAVNTDNIAARSVVMACIALGFGVLALGVVVFLRLGTSLAIAGWATSAAGLILLTLLQVVIIALLFSMGVLNTRAAAEVIPLRDCPYFIEGVRHMELCSESDPQDSMELRILNQTLSNAESAPLPFPAKVK